MTTSKKTNEENQTQKIEKEDKPEIIAIHFILPYKIYAVGDIAGFSKEQAEKILALKPSVAEAYQQ